MEVILAVILTGILAGIIEGSVLAGLMAAGIVALIPLGMLVAYLLFAYGICWLSKVWAK